MLQIQSTREFCFSRSPNFNSSPVSSKTLTLVLLHLQPEPPMPSSKRCRILPSPSLKDVWMFDKVKPIGSASSGRGKPTLILHSTSISKPSASKPDQPRQRIFTLGSSVQEMENWSSVMRFYTREVCGFLKACYRCKKRIGEQDEVFMYNSLGAFCSLKCRSKQIGLDNKLEAASKKCTKSASALNNANGQIGAQSTVGAL